MLANAITVVALTLLAWHFGKWWIILFYPLLMITYEAKRKDDE
jgi:hypothetical protein